MASDGPARKHGLSAPVSRRTVLGGLTLIPVAAVLGSIPPAASAETTFQYLSPHQAAVLDAATRRLIPGPTDNPQETTPGAHEANVVNYLDIMLAAFSFSPPMVHAGGPWSNRAGGSQDFMATFVPLNRAQTYAWQRRLTQLRDQYTSGIALLDQLAGGDFTAVKPATQDSILVYGQALTFTNLLFGHTIEAMYSNPEYGGNANLVGWQDIKYPGDSQPRGYTPSEVEAAQWDVVVVTNTIDRLRQNWGQLVAKLGGRGGVGAGH